MRTELKKQFSKLKKMSNSIHLSEKRLIELEKLKEMLLDATDEEKTEAKIALDKSMDENLTFLKTTIEAYKFRQEAPCIQIGNTKIDMREWCTISQYAKLFKYKSTMNVSNQIRRGTIPPERINYIKDLDIKLIRLP
ncbi:MAG: hypothetical protein EAZ53_07950 [Bacteroidetes bacterium]|nr:MAG: hypothetical protein EAZ53_07950 [Bacteroidota bacterium]